MNVVAVTPWFPTDDAPTMGTFVASDVAALAARPEVSSVRVVHLIPPAQDDGEPETTRDGIAVQRISMNPRSPLSVLRAGQDLRTAVAGADTVHTMAFPALLPMAWWRPQVPWVHTEHWSGLTTPSTLPLTWRLLLPLLWPLVRRPDVVTAVCEYLATPIRARRGDDPTTVVPCIVPSPEHLQSRPMRPRTPTRLVAVGGLVDRKDPLLAVDTVAELVGRGHPARLTWIGDGPLRTKVQRHARRRKVEHLVRLPGAADAAGVRTALADADVFFLPTRADNFCVSAAEALVEGRPVVVGATGGQGEYIDPRMGALVHDQTAEAYADAVIDVERRTLHLNASDVAATVADRFSPEHVTNGYLEAYARARR
ncbi:glycosyltransferase [Ruania alba]|uniref:Glycosyltransferase involved in cell wall bisynthesis n=1 Tax=Ruania alba TaxID=648782 RepID=A0A1H5N9G8_9MICO|nr:glycosyltransferase [Ruania alba]SEE98272.1 Glycosyltransferase involved in cell wall bisynthesis [Ruania alba]